MSQSSSTRCSSTATQPTPSSLGEGLHILSDLPPHHKLSVLSSPITSFIPSSEPSSVSSGITNSFRGYSYNETSSIGAASSRAAGVAACSTPPPQVGTQMRRTSEVVGAPNGGVGAPIGSRPPPPTPPHRTCSASGSGVTCEGKSQVERDQATAASSVASLPTTSGVSVGGGSSSFTR